MAELVLEARAPDSQASVLRAAADHKIQQGWGNSWVSCFGNSTESLTLILNTRH